MKDTKNISALRQIVASSSAKKIDGKLMDLYTASAILKIYDNLSTKNQLMMAKMPLEQMAHISFRLLTKLNKKIESIKLKDLIPESVSVSGTKWNNAIKAIMKINAFPTGKVLINKLNKELKKNKTIRDNDDLEFFVDDFIYNNELHTNPKWNKAFDDLFNAAKSANLSGSKIRQNHDFNIGDRVKTPGGYRGRIDHQGSLGAYWVAYDGESHNRGKYFDAHQLTPESVTPKQILPEQTIDDIKVGDIWYATWGYEQTNVSFFQIINKSAKMVTIREIKSQKKQTGQWTTDGGVATPLRGKFMGSPMKKKLQSGGSIKIESYMFARPWDGNPVRYTSYG